MIIKYYKTAKSLDVQNILTTYLQTDVTGCDTELNMFVLLQSWNFGESGISSDAIASRSTQPPFSNTS